MLKELLDNKPLYYDKIDYTRMPRIYKKIKHLFVMPKIIHIIGTNGKGTTGRFLATALYNLGYKTGHYTSPHIISFNERIWFNGSNADDKVLDKAHSELSNILTEEDIETLSYFEYTTLIAMCIFKDLDYVVLEAGLGGEYDATAVFDKILTLVTPIDIDHEAFLGSTVTKIATTKLNAIQNRAILSQQRHEEVYDVAYKRQENKEIKIYKIDELLRKNDYDKIDAISMRLNLATYLKDNLKLSVSALKILGIDYNIESFKDSKLFGRLSFLSDNIVVDVGHNTLASDSIVRALKGKKYILVYNSYKDKNYKDILRILKPIIKHVEIIDVNEPRIESREKLQDTLSKLSIKYLKFNKINADSRYLVFGSFSVVDAFMRVYNA